MLAQEKAPELYFSNYKVAKILQGKILYLIQSILNIEWRYHASVKPEEDMHLNAAAQLHILRLSVEKLGKAICLYIGLHINQRPEL